MSTRRKLHAHRGAEVEGDNNNSNSNTSPVFTWATDRTRPAAPDALSCDQAFDVQLIYRAPHLASSNHPVPQAPNNSSICKGKDASVGNSDEFKWISDYLEGSEDDESEQQPPNGL